MRMQKVAKSKGMQAAEAKFMIDCGRASRCTRGMLFLLTFELAPPPTDRQFLL
jgi:hypothetical protein